MARRIALVEDDPTIRQNYVDALTRAGYEVAAFGDRPSASRTLAARLPELAIIDIGLGADIDGGFAPRRKQAASGGTLPCSGRRSHTSRGSVRRLPVDITQR